VDADGDGNFVGPNDTFPIPSAFTVGFPGRKAIVNLSRSPLFPTLTGTTRFINDVSLDGGSGIIGAVIGSGFDTVTHSGISTKERYESCYRTFLPGADLDGVAASYFFPGYNAKRLLVTTDVPWRVGSGFVSLRLAMVCLVAVDNHTSKLAILNATEPSAPGLLNGIEMPSKYGLLQGIARDDGGRIILSTETNLLILDPLLLSKPMRLLARTLPSSAPSGTAVPVPQGFCALGAG